MGLRPVSPPPRSVPTEVSPRQPDSGCQASTVLRLKPPRGTPGSASSLRSRRQGPAGGGLARPPSRVAGGPCTGYVPMAGACPGADASSSARAAFCPPPRACSFLRPRRLPHVTRLCLTGGASSCPHGPSGAGELARERAVRAVRAGRTLGDECPGPSSPDEVMRVAHTGTGEGPRGSAFANPPSLPPSLTRLDRRVLGGVPPTLRHWDAPEGGEAAGGFGFHQRT